VVYTAIQIQFQCSIGIALRHLTTMGGISCLHTRPYISCASVMSPDSSNAGFAWLFYALLTVASWGVYGVMLHTGQMNMGDPVNGRYKAFLFVGIAYFLTAVLAPIAVLVANGATWTFPAKGLWWSLIAGIVGAIGAFGVLLAFGAKGTPAVVMSIVFAGAPIVNAIYSLSLHPPAGGFGSIKPQFFLGIVLAAVGGCLVTLYKPNPPAKKPQAVAAQMNPGTPPAH
jgi:drug/metabolite transporter (DMT)-like permease